ncbi:MAG: hypothetical protein AB1798_09370 [Spirochaetota bacterium]
MKKILVLLSILIILVSVGVNLFAGGGKEKAEPAGEKPARE